MNMSDEGRKKILILGADGYLGWSLFVFLKQLGHTVYGVDNFSRRDLVYKQRSASMTPIRASWERPIFKLDVTDPKMLYKCIESCGALDAIVHLAEQPSAPYSMKGRAEAVATQQNNLIGTMNLIWAVRDLCPDTQIVKLGTLGEYGDWIWDRKGMSIPESNRLRVQTLRSEGDTSFWDAMAIPTPKWAGSFYHWSKVFDSFNLEFACNLWNLKVTDLNQGPVYGVRIPGMGDHELTRFDYDECFGTVINRFCVQAVLGMPLTVYGKGGQTRGFINLNDAMKAILLVINNPPASGGFRVINQLTEVYRIVDLASMVAELTHVQIQHLPNPRKELESHVYQPRFTKLRELGLGTPRLVKDELSVMLAEAERFKDNIREGVILPKTSWTRQEAS